MLEATWKSGTTLSRRCCCDVGLLQSPGLSWLVFLLSQHGEENLTLVNPPLTSLEVCEYVAKWGQMWQKV